MKRTIASVLMTSVILLPFAYGCNNLYTKTRMMVYDESGFSAGSKVYEEEIDSLEIDWHFGNVEIIETEREVSVTEKESLPEKNKLRSKVENGALKIMFWQSGLEDSLDNVSDKNVVIKIPEKLSDIRIVTVSASVNAEKLSAKTLDINTTSGNVESGVISAEKAEIGSVSGELRTNEIYAVNDVNYETTSGKIEVKKVECAEVDFSSVSGAIILNEIVGCEKLEAESTSGGIKIGKARAATIKIETVSGKIEAELFDCKNCNMQTTSGSLDLSLRIGANVLFSSNGKFYGDGGNRRVYGDGRCVVVAESVSGNLSVSYSE